MYYRCPIEDNNTLQFDCDAEVDISKQCVITAFSPIEDFTKLLEIGFNSEIGIPIFGFRCRNMFYLLNCMILCIYMKIKFSISNNLWYLNSLFYLLKLLKDITILQSLFKIIIHFL